MPFASAKQRKYLYAKHPQIAHKWSAEEKQMSKSLPSTAAVGRRQTVEKGFSTQGVARPLARRTAAAGRNARKVVQTGVIGKGLLKPKMVEGAFGAYAKPGRKAQKLAAVRAKATPAPDHRAYGFPDPQPTGGWSVQKGVLADVGASLHGINKPAQAAAAPAAGGLKAVRSTAMAPKAAAGTGAKKPVAKMGEWKTIDQRELSQRRARKTQRRGEAAMGAGAGALIAAEAKWPGATRQGLRLVRALSSKTNRRLVHPEVRRDIARTALKTPQGMTQAAGIGLLGAGGIGYGQGRAREAYHQSKINERRKANKAKVAKRRYDPEDERRHRQGFQAGALASGGALATGYGVRGVRRDTRDLFNTPAVAEGKEPKRHASLKGVPYEDLDDRGKKVLDERYARESAHHAGAKAINSLKSKKGLLVRGKPAALLGGGLASLAVAAGHQARRHESRYD